MTATLPDKHFIADTATILQGLDRLNALSGGAMTLVVLDPHGRMRGTVTDGDIRRGLLRGVQLHDPIERVIHTDFQAIGGVDDTEGIRRARQSGLRLLPLLANDGTVERLIDLRETETLLPVSAILMAGGRGERLRPMTLTTPKPLLPIAGRPIIDYNIANLARAGIADVTVCVNYLAEQLEAFFATPRHGIEVRCVREPKFLGTIGAASLVERKDPSGNTLVMNSDLLTNVSLEEMYLRHRDERAAVTIAAIPYSVSVPYAILEAEGSQVRGLMEKPTYSYFANAGIYIFSNRLLDTLARYEPTDAPELIERAIASGEKVVYFPLRGTWIDIGSPADFRHAEELMALRPL